MVRIVCFEVSLLMRFLKPNKYLQAVFKILLDARDHVSCPNFLKKITLKVSLDHKDNLIHLGSLLVVILALHTHTNSIRKSPLVMVTCRDKVASSHSLNKLLHKYGYMRSLETFGMAK